MAWVNITQSRGLVKHPVDDTYLPLLDDIGSLTVSLSTASKQSEALSTDAAFITLVADTACFFEIGSNPTAVSFSSQYLAADVYVTKICEGGDKVAVINAT